MTVDFTVVLPELIVAFAAIAVLVADLYVTKRLRWMLPALSLAGVTIAGIDVIAQHATNKLGFSGSVALDGFSLFCDGIFLIAALLTIVLSVDYLGLQHVNLGEYYVLVLGTTSGMMLMAAANSLIVLFLALETFSICLYVLAGFERTRSKAQESALKYFLLSAFASAFLLYGMALVYGATNSTQFTGIADALKQGNPGNDPILLAGAALLVVGLTFKMSAVPFHAWTPDVYEGAPTPITALMSVGTKLAAFAAFVRLFVMALPSVHPHWLALIWMLAIFTMAVGNIAAVVQTNVKRMLAYSSIAQAGYMMIALYTAHGDGKSGDGVPSLLFYFAIYAFMNVGAFAVVAALARSRRRSHDSRRLRRPGFQPSLARRLDGAIHAFPGQFSAHRRLLGEILCVSNRAPGWPRRTGSNRRSREPRVCLLLSASHFCHVFPRGGASQPPACNTGLDLDCSLCGFCWYNRAGRVAVRSAHACSRSQAAAVAARQVQHQAAGRFAIDHQEGGGRS